MTINPGGAVVITSQAGNMLDFQQQQYQHLPEQSIVQGLPQLQQVPVVCVQNPGQEQQLLHMPTLVPPHHVQQQQQALSPSASSQQQLEQLARQAPQLLVQLQDPSQQQQQQQLVTMMSTDEQLQQQLQQQLYLDNSRQLGQLAAQPQVVVMPRLGVGNVMTAAQVQTVLLQQHQQQQEQQQLQQQNQQLMLQLQAMQQQLATLTQQQQQQQAILQPSLQLQPLVLASSAPQFDSIPGSDMTFHNWPLR
jgi:exonuclease SbcC